jgi:hypothetical protein
VNSPVFGVNWNPPEDRQRIVRNLVTYLEDKRALYNPYDMEYGLWVTDSILEIRRELTEVLKDCPDEEALTRPIKTMRTACRNYLDLVGYPS